MDENDQQHQHQHQQQQQHATVATAAASATRAKRRLKLNTILKERNEFPFRTRNKIDDLAEEYLEQQEADAIDEGVDEGAAAVAVAFADDTVADGAGAGADADDVNDRSGRRIKLMSMLEQYDDFILLRTRDKINTLTEEYLSKLETDIHEMICDQNAGELYKGLDSSRDTEAEVEKALRTFPDLLSHKKQTKWGRNRQGELGWVEAEEYYRLYPIHCLFKTYDVNDTFDSKINLKAVSFIAIAAQLGNELNQFAEEQRGGLLCRPDPINRVNNDTLCGLIRDYSSSDNEAHKEFFENVCLTLLVRLRRMGLLKKDDIRDFDVINFMCCCDFSQRTKTFQFLIETDPTLLLNLLPEEDDIWFPLHGTAYNSIRGFQVVFELCIRYYPKTLGIRLPFKRIWDKETSFQRACEEHGKDTVMKIVENTLNNSDIPINITEALFLAAIDNNIHLDCVYLLLKREPDVLVRLLSGLSNNNDDNFGSDQNENDDDDDDDNFSSDHNENDDDGDHDTDKSNKCNGCMKRNVNNNNNDDNSVSQNIGLSQSDHTGTTHTVTTTTAALRARVAYLEELNSSYLEQVTSLEGEKSSLLARVASLEGEKSKIGTTIINSSEANMNDTFSSAKLSLDDVTGLPNNIQVKDNKRKELPILNVDTNNGKRKRESAF